MKILLLFDLSISLKPEEYVDYWKSDDFESERHTKETLENLGHTVTPFGLHDDLDPLLKEVKDNPPDLIFNLSEAFRNHRRYEPHLVSLLELLEIPYTGSRPEALHLCKNKGMAKKILSFHRVKVPDFLISRRSSPIRSLKGLKFPVFIKPLDLEASEGISQLSFSENAKDALERVRYLHERYETSVIVEEYIDGRELYVAVLGNEKLQAFPPRELHFKHVPEGEPRFATFRAKWDDTYRKKWGIKTGAGSLSEEIELKLMELSKRIYRLLGLSGYGRVDFRMTPEGEFVCLEVNPNPSIERDSDVALAAAKAGLSYDDLIQKILNLAIGAIDPQLDRSPSRKKKK